MPPLGPLAHRYQRTQPYIYSDDEIGRLLRAARQLPSQTGLRPRTYTTLLGLLVVTGMRISEVVRLDRDDVDLTKAVLTIRKTKFGKSRLVPLHPSTQRALKQYADDRDRILPKPMATTFLIGDHGRRLTINVVEQTFVKLSRQVGLRGPSERTGVDVEHHLPQLSTYLGHAHPTDTVGRQGRR